MLLKINGKNSECPAASTSRVIVIVMVKKYLLQTTLVIQCSRPEISKQLLLGSPN